VGKVKRKRKTFSVPFSFLFSKSVYVLTEVFFLKKPLTRACWAYIDREGAKYNQKEKKMTHEGDNKTTD